VCVCVFVQEKLYSPAQLPELMSMSDYVVVATPYTPATHQLVNATAIAAMKPTGVLVNVGRGKCIDETALIQGEAAAGVQGRGKSRVGHGNTEGGQCTLSCCRQGQCCSLCHSTTTTSNDKRNTVFLELLSKLFVLEVHCHPRRSLYTLFLAPQSRNATLCMPRPPSLYPSTPPPSHQPFKPR